LAAAFKTQDRNGPGTNYFSGYLWLLPAARPAEASRSEADNPLLSIRLLVSFGDEALFIQWQNSISL
jgi:hypothetical protein